MITLELPPIHEGSDSFNLCTTISVSARGDRYISLFPREERCASCSCRCCGTLISFCRFNIRYKFIKPRPTNRCSLFLFYPADLKSVERFVLTKNKIFTGNLLNLDIGIAFRLGITNLVPILTLDLVVLLVALWKDVRWIYLDLPFCNQQANFVSQGKYSGPF